MAPRRLTRRIGRAWVWGLVGVTLSLGIARAEQPTVPIYPHAVSLERREFKLGALPMQVSYYETQASPKEVVAFYQKTLLAQQWTHPQGRSISTEQEEVTLFTHGREQLLVTAEPSKDTGLTQVTVNYWQQEQPVSPDVAGTVAQPGQQPGPCPQQPCSGQQPAAAQPPPAPVPGNEPYYLPVYPGAVRQMFIEETHQGYWAGAYQTADTPEQVMAFYRRTLGTFGWREVRTQQIATTLPVPRPEQLPANLPKEALEKLAHLGQAGPVASTAVIFDGAQGTAVVSVSKIPMVEGTMVGLNMYHHRIYEHTPSEAAHAAQ